MCPPLFAKKAEKKRFRVYRKRRKTGRPQVCRRHRWAEGTMTVPGHTKAEGKQPGIFDFRQHKPDPARRQSLKSVLLHENQINGSFFHLPFVCIISIPRFRKKSSYSFVTAAGMLPRMTSPIRTMRKRYLSTSRRDGLQKPPRLALHVLYKVFHHLRRLGTSRQPAWVKPTVAMTIQNTVCDRPA